MTIDEFLAVLRKTTGWVVINGQIRQLGTRCCPLQAVYGKLGTNYIEAGIRLGLSYDEICLIAKIADGTYTFTEGNSALRQAMLDATNTTYHREVFV